MPKAVRRSDCRDKHYRPQCDSNLGPLTPQSDALTTRLLRPTVIMISRYAVRVISAFDCVSAGCASISDRLFMYPNRMMFS